MTPTTTPTPTPPATSRDFPRRLEDFPTTTRLGSLVQLAATNRAKVDALRSDIGLWRERHADAMTRAALRAEDYPDQARILDALAAEKMAPIVAHKLRECETAERRAVDSLKQAERVVSSQWDAYNRLLAQRDGVAGRLDVARSALATAPAVLHGQRRRDVEDLAAEIERIDIDLGWYL